MTILKEMGSVDQEQDQDLRVLKSGGQSECTRIRQSMHIDNGWRKKLILLVKFACSLLWYVSGNLSRPVGRVIVSSGRSM